VIITAEQARAGTTLVTVAALGVVLGLSAALVLPLLLPWSGAAAIAFGCVGLSLSPFIGFWLVARRRALPTSPRLPLAACTVALCTGLVLLPLWNVYRAELRVLNHGDDPLVLLVDDRRVARVEPSSGESPLSGVELTLPAGVHEFVVTSALDGRELLRVREHLSGGRPHLFAPLSTSYCFAIERRAYGQATGEALESEPLEGDSRFWALPEGIAWFTPNPEPGSLGTSGGTLSSLRQRRCGR
jgi:hypothetical protein